METARIKTTVQAGGRIEVIVPDLKAGESVEVTVCTGSPEGRKRSALDILAESPGHRLFKTAEEVDAYIREERDSWEH